MKSRKELIAAMAQNAMDAMFETPHEGDITANEVISAAFSVTAIVMECALSIGADPRAFEQAIAVLIVMLPASKAESASTAPKPYSQRN